MEMTVLAYDPYVTEEYAKNLGVEQVDFETLLTRSDYITIVSVSDNSPLYSISTPFTGPLAK